MVVGRIDDFRQVSIPKNRNTSMNDPPDIGSPISVNGSGGFYEKSKQNTFLEKWEVISVQPPQSINRSWVSTTPMCPPMKDYRIMNNVTGI
jgi:hypothetical protein